MTAADQVWNRAALESGGESPGPGDRALSSLLLVHGLVMNGGVHHALEGVTEAELVAAIAGFDYFGLSEVAAFLRGASIDPVLRESTEHAERLADQQYAALVPNDAHLVYQFKAVFRDRVDEFTPLGKEPSN